jgi:hypothetical protein
MPEKSLEARRKKSLKRKLEMEVIIYEIKKRS